MMVAREDDAAAIAIRIAKLHQLFNSLDPSPFYEKELDKDADAYIVDSVDEFPLPKPLRLRPSVPPRRGAIERLGWATNAWTRPRL